MGAELKYNDIVTLVRKEVEVIGLYDQALESVTNTLISDKLQMFQDDHKRHLQILLDIINEVEGGLNLGEVNTGFSQYDERAIENGEVYRDLLRAETGLNDLYQKSISWDVDSKTGDILDNNLEDEQQHLKFITTLISDLFNRKDQRES